MFGLTPQRRARIAGLCEALGEYLDEAAVADVYRAYKFGQRAHQGQMRQSGEPYINHPLAVACILAEMHLDSRSLMAALLHDVIEDTPTAREQLAALFGEDVANLVDGVSKIDQMDFDTQEQAEAENFRKMLLAMSRDIRVILIKLADRLHNMRTLESLAADKQRRISRQTLDIYAPIANRLGMRTWSSELEDLSFAYLYPKRYDAISKALKRRQSHRRASLKKVCVNLQRALQEHDIAGQVIGREKNVYNVYRKMLTKRVPLERVQDIDALRVIVDTAGACYRALGVVHNLYKPIPGRFKDYIAIPKANGYQSLHTVVFGTFGQIHEAQIRTHDMHRVAQSGIASHWLYKSGPGVAMQPQEMARQWLLDLLDNQKDAGTPGEFLEHLRVDLFPDRVYVFTPKGEIKKLPRGATALDFAYAVHSDIGNHCIGAKVNSLMAPLHTVLRNGDRIEVITSSMSQPSPTWLEYAVTSKARAAIRGHLKHQRHRDAARLGRKLLQRALKSIGYRGLRVRSADKTALLNTLGLKAWTELLIDIGVGNRSPSIVARQLVPEGTDPTEPAAALQPLLIQGAEGMLINYARCCRPVPGDPIIGIFSTGRGIVVHTTDCLNIRERSKRPENWVGIRWAEQVAGDFEVALRLETAHRPGVLARLATIVAEHDSNIVNVVVVEHDKRYASILFTLKVRNRDHLERIDHNLRDDPDVIGVQRIKG